MTPQKVLAGFWKLRALVVGDVCLDRWCRYDPQLSDPSRETGIPRLGVVATEVTPGAAGTVAGNLAALRAGRVAILGVMGEDGFGFELDQALAARGIDRGLLIRSKEIITFTYTKLINTETGIEDQPRVDFINTRPLPRAVERQLIGRLQVSAPEFDVILVSDQTETPEGGTITPGVRAALEEIARRRLVWVDSRVRIEQFRGVVLKPNREEAEAAAVRVCGKADFRALREHTRAPALIVTHGKEGALVVDDTGEHWAAGRAVEQPVDICGAGDSFSAGAAMAMKITGSAMEAAQFGNLVASVTVRKKGTGTASPEEVLAEA